MTNDDALAAFCSNDAAAEVDHAHGFDILPKLKLRTLVNGWDTNRGCFEISHRVCSTTSGAGSNESSGKLNKLRANVPAMSRFVMVSASTSYTGMVGKVPTGSPLRGSMWRTRLRPLPPPKCCR